jgi:hypothetical protein
MLPRLFSPDFFPSNFPLNWFFWLLFSFFERASWLFMNFLNWILSFNSLEKRKYFAKKQKKKMSYFLHVNKLKSSFKFRKLKSLLFPEFCCTFSKLHSSFALFFPRKPIFKNKTIHFFEFLTRE